MSEDYQILYCHTDHEERLLGDSEKYIFWQFAAIETGIDRLPSDCAEKWTVRIVPTKDRSARRLRSWILRCRPIIIHLGSYDCDPHPGVEAGDFLGIFPLAKLLKGPHSVRCVVMTIPHTESQAEAIAEHVDVVVSMQSADKDRVEEFITSIYESIGDGLDMSEVVMRATESSRHRASPPEPASIWLTYGSSAPRSELLNIFEQRPAQHRVVPKSAPKWVPSRKAHLVGTRAMLTGSAIDLQLATGDGGLNRVPVELGVSAPPQVRPGDEFTARFVAYTSNYGPELHSLLGHLSPRSRHSLGVARTRWATGGEVAVRLRASGLLIDGPVQVFEWSGHYDIIDFDLRVPEDAAPRTVVLKFDASVHGIPAGRARVDVRIEPLVQQANAAERTRGQGEVYSSAFASYAHADRLRVLDHVLAMYTLTGIDVFLDCLSLRASENFERRILDEVVSRQLYLLFWSRAASKSEWVDREWRLAHSKKDPENFRVQPLEPHTLAPPPNELAHLNFDDPLLLLRHAARLSS